jgi:hypothetical protein
VRFPTHRNLTSFDVDASPVDKALIKTLAELSLLKDAQGIQLIAERHRHTHLSTTFDYSDIIMCER